ncbi:MAG TPA: hypothetical protein DCF33_07730 [Saprospirales bacterium]|nr:hypothetical protein [Saprospirales bacterium]
MRGNNLPSLSIQGGFFVFWTVFACYMCGRAKLTFTDVLQESGRQIKVNETALVCPPAYTDMSEFGHRIFFKCLIINRMLTGTCFDAVLIGSLLIFPY